MGDIPPLRPVTARRLRQMFNSGGYWQRAQTGEYGQEMLRDGHPSPPRAREPFCTRSQIIAYMDERGQRVAVVHQYVRPDGTLGAGGKPDPKRLLVEGVLYAVTEAEKG